VDWFIDFCICVALGFLIIMMGALAALVTYLTYMTVTTSW